MKRLFPAPIVSLMLFGLWLLLNRSLSPGSLLLAAVLAVALPSLIQSLRPTPVRIRYPLKLLRLVVIVLMDTAVSNYTMAKALVFKRSDQLHSEFILVPLDLRDPNGLAALAVICTFNPGTVWSELSRDSSTLLLHVLQMGEPEAFIAEFKTRYERPLMEIFE
ncbi:Na+/H+ antiporter subunit E [Variovorax sp. HJSM1_2]|uniref:Na+/H+ antiporter subunit E n=1 Tax=Variovorax sp. HJSM1_2 TaxID=3366263 RepID=UPI003BD749F5